MIIICHCVCVQLDETIAEATVATRALNLFLQVNLTTDVLIHEYIIYSDDGCKVCSLTYDDNDNT